VQASVRRSAKRSIGFGLFVFIGGPLICSLITVLLVPMLIAAFASSISSTFTLPTPGAVGEGDNAVTLAAREIAGLLRDCRGMTSQNAIDNGCTGNSPRFAAYDPKFQETAYYKWGQQRCPGCEAWQNGSFQCVSFVLAAYSQLHPLDFTGNGNQFAGLYSTQEAKDRGYTTIVAGYKNLPLSPGDIMAWSGGKYGHVSIVLSWEAPKNGNPGQITFAQANARSSIDTLALDKDTFKPITNDGYWNGYEVTTYIHPGWLPLAGGDDPSKQQPYPTNVEAVPTNNPYPNIAREAAKQAGINEDIFVTQIQVESGFNPKAVSSQGALGIAQLMPDTAKELGVDPFDPVASLYGAARLMASHLKYYSGDYAKALAAYNAGRGTVDKALGQCGANWRRPECIPQETVDYLHKILGGG